MCCSVGGEGHYGGWGGETNRHKTGETQRVLHRMFRKKRKRNNGMYWHYAMLWHMLLELADIILLCFIYLTNCVSNTYSWSLRYFWRSLVYVFSIYQSVCDRSLWNSNIFHTLCTTSRYWSRYGNPDKKTTTTYFSPTPCLADNLIASSRKLCSIPTWSVYSCILQTLTKQ